MPVLLLLLLAACSRDLALPEQLPPRIDVVAPAQGFAGDFVQLTGDGLADPSLQVLFDVRTAVIVTPPEKRDGHTLVVQVPLNVLSPDVSVTGAQGSAKAPQPFRYLGAGHPTTVALRATLSLAPDIGGVAALAGGGAAVFDQRYGTVRVRAQDGTLGKPTRTGILPRAVFGPANAAWVLDDYGGGFLRPMNLTANPPTVGTAVQPDGRPFLGDGSPSGTRFASPGTRSVLLYALPSGLHVEVPLPASASLDVRGVRFVSENVLVGITAAESFRIDLGSGTPVVTLGPALAQTPEDVPAMAADPSGLLAYSTGPASGALLSWTGTAAPAPATALTTQVHPDAFAFAESGAVLAADSTAGVVVRCSTGDGSLLSAQQLPGVRALTVLDSGFVLAATGAGTALLFPNGGLVRSDSIGIGMRGIAVDPVCGDVLAATDYGPLRVSHDTLVPQPLDVSLQLDGVRSSEAGVAAFSGKELYAYAPTADCKLAGSFKHVGTSSLGKVFDVSLGTAFVAAVDDQRVELVPLAAGTPQKLDYGASGLLIPAWHNDALTVVHPQGANVAVSTYAPGTLTQIGTLTLADGPPTILRRVRFADVWEVAQGVYNDATVLTATHVTFWSAAGGVLTTADVPAAVTTPAGNSADGFMMVGISGTGAGLDTLLLEVSQGRLIQQPGPHVDLSSQPGEIISSPDGGRLYVSLPGTSALAVIE